MVTEFSLSWLELSTLEFERFCLRRRKKPDGGGTGKRGKKGKSSTKGKKMWTSVRLTVVELGKERKRRWVNGLGWLGWLVE